MNTPWKEKDLRRCGLKRIPRRVTPLFVIDDYRTAADFLTDHYETTLGIITEAALICFIEQMPDCFAKRGALATLQNVRRFTEAPVLENDEATVEQSEADPSEPIQSPAAPPGSNGKPRSTILAI